MARSDIRIIATSKGVNRTSQKEGYIYNELDVTDEVEIRKIFTQYKPDAVINTAAMTNVDACETERETCDKMNIESVEFLCRICEEFNTHLVHISTDFVFDGVKGPYSELDKPNPLHYYAKSKLEGEKRVENCKAPWTIIRTILIYGVVDDLNRSNIILWVKNSLSQKKVIRVVTDQFRAPTLAEDLAEACVQAVMRGVTGMFHVSGEEIMPIIEIANRTADFFNLDKSYIVPVSSDELKQPAKRPLKTGFILDKARKELDFKPHSLKEGLAIVAEQLQARKI